MPKVAIANPTRQYSHQVALALQEGGMLGTFYTTIWYHRNIFPYNLLPDRLASKIGRLLRNRSCNALDPKKIKQFPNLEIARQIINRLINDYFTREQLYYNLIYKTFDHFVAREIKRTRPDLFIGYEETSRYSFSLCKSMKIPCVLDLASLYWKFQRDVFIKEASINNHFKISLSHLNHFCKPKDTELDMADFIIVQSTLTKKTLIDAGIDPAKIFLVPLGFNSDIFSSKKSYNCNEIFTILFVGQVQIHKGLHYLLQAYKQLNIKDSRLLIIGPLVNRDLLEPYKGHFHYIHSVDQMTLSKYYREADISVAPSLIDSFAQVTCEAMASGTPVIVTENAGTKDCIQDGINGFIVPAFDYNALKEKILFFYENRDELEKFGRRAATSIKDYTWDNHHKRIREIVTKIITNYKK